MHLTLPFVASASASQCLIILYIQVAFKFMPWSSKDSDRISYYCYLVWQKHLYVML